MEAEETDNKRSRLINNRFPSHMLQEFAALRQDLLLCDFVVVVDGEQFNLHKLVLASASFYFRLAILEDSQLSQITLDDINIEIFEHLANYMYSGRLSVESKDLPHMYTAAKKLDMSDVALWCMREMTLAMTHHTCVDFMTFGEKNHHELLVDACRFFIVENFSKVCESNTFLKLSHKAIESIYETGSLKCESELQVYSAFKRWLDKNGEYKDKVNRILECIRFELIPMHENKMLLSDSVMEDAEHADLIHRAIQFQTGDDRFKIRSASTYSTPRSTPFLMVLGGKGAKNEDVDEVHLFDMATGKPTDTPSVARLLVGRHNATVTVANNILFFFGGSDKRDFSDAVFCYNPLSNTWCTLATLPLKCESSTAFTLGDFIYIVGGRGSKHLKCVQRYCIASNSWQMMGNELPYYLYYAASSVVDNKAYVAGGARPGTVAHDILLYDDVIDRWGRKARMLQPRMSHGMCTDGTLMYIVGGTDGKKILQTAELYDPVASQCTMLSPCPWRRAYTMAVFYNGHVYLAVGSGTSSARPDKDGRQDTVLIYDIDKDTWSEANGRLPNGGVWQCCCATISLPPRR